MIDASWHGFLAPLSFFTSTNLSEELFADAVNACQSMTTVSGSLGLTTARDAFITALSKFAIPPAVVSALEAYVEPSPYASSKGGGITGGIGAGVGILADNLGLGSGSAGNQAGPPGLSKRNLAFLKALISSALFLAGSLGTTWFQVFEALQNAEYVLFGKSHSQANGIAGSGPNRRGSAAGAPPSIEKSSIDTTASSTTNQSPVLFDLDTNSVQLNIQRLFDSSRNLEDDSFKDFIEALCKLSKEMIEMQTGLGSQVVDLDSSLSSGGGLLSPELLTPGGAGGEGLHRRRASGIHLPKSPVSVLSH